MGHCLCSVSPLLPLISGVRAPELHSFFVFFLLHMNIYKYISIYLYIYIAFTF